MKKIELIFTQTIGCVKMTTISEGNFNSLPIDKWDREMLEDAYKAVTKANRWDFLRRPDVPGPNGFMFSEWPQMKDIDTFMEYGGHSGASYGMTMRAMEFIAKWGWSEYVKSILQQKQKEEENERKRMAKEDSAAKALNNLFQTAAAVDNAIRRAGPMDPLSFAERLRSDPQIRQVIPDIDEQADAMKRFSEGKLSYAEMRSLCG